MCVLQSCLCELIPLSVVIDDKHTKWEELFTFSYMASLLREYPSAFGRLDVEAHRRQMEKGRFLFIDNATSADVLLQSAPSPTKATGITSFSLK